MLWPEKMRRHVSPSFISLLFILDTPSHSVPFLYKKLCGGMVSLKTDSSSQYTVLLQASCSYLLGTRSFHNPLVISCLGVLPMLS